ncbi:MAG: acyl--CoA ligase [Mollicutes bacterium]|nr:acyl--CoA ligase [Mollicutes bacterium]
MGIPVPGLEVRLINSETKEEVEIGEIGVLQLSGLPVMMRYHKNESETKKVIYFDEDGKRWLDTGDCLSKDADGFYKYHGREKRNFVSGCDNIYPERLEQFLPTIPGVREAVVVPFPLDLEQNTPVYYISLGIGDINVDALEFKIKKVVKKRFGDSWKPEKIIFTNEPLKRMTSGKIDLKYYVDSCKQLGGITRSRKSSS